MQTAISPDLTENALYPDPLLIDGKALMSNKNKAQNFSRDLNALQHRLDMYRSV